MKQYPTVVFIFISPVLGSSHVLMSYLYFHSFCEYSLSSGSVGLSPLEIPASLECLFFFWIVFLLQRSSSYVLETSLVMCAVIIVSKSVVCCFTLVFPDAQKLYVLKPI